ncbi:MAG: hypothetical protein EOO73_17860 [Myxococcales bacterium]|nr:MAG: hypothetical protein EOO73_17860 [Myxococcales bacterium]
MNEPLRWLEAARALSPAERRVLTADQTAPVPASAKAAVKQALVAQLAASAAAASSLKAPVTSAVVPAARASLLKSTLAGFALGVAASGGVSALLPAPGGSTAPRATELPRAPSPAASSPVASPVPSRAEPPLQPPSSSHPGQAVSSRSASSAISAAAASASAPALPSPRSVPTEGPPLQATIDESSRLARARALLRNDAAAAALEVLEGMRRDHPRGALIQEREILTIESLASVGERAAAAAAARDFLARFPSSPHTAAARRALPNESPP